MEWNVEKYQETCGRVFSLRFFYPQKEEYKKLLEEHGFSIESLVTYDLDTKLGEGDAGLRNWVSQIFSDELAWFTYSEREGFLNEIECELRPVQWDGANWHLANRRIQAVARKLG